MIFPLGANAVATAVKESKAKYALVAWLEEIARNCHFIPWRKQAGWAAAEDRRAGERISELSLQALPDSAAPIWRVACRCKPRQARLLGVGGLLVINRQLTLGQLVAAELVVTAVVAGISKVAKHLESYYDLLASLDKLGYLDRPSGRTKRIRTRHLRRNRLWSQFYTPWFEGNSKRRDEPSRHYRAERLGQNHASSTPSAATGPARLEYRD